MRERCTAAQEVKDNVYSDHLDTNIKHNYKRKKNQLHYSINRVSIYQLPAIQVLHALYINLRNFCTLSPLPAAQRGLSSKSEIDERVPAPRCDPGVYVRICCRPQDHGAGEEGKRRGCGQQSGNLSLQHRPKRVCIKFPLWNIILAPVRVSEGIFGASPPVQNVPASLHSGSDQGICSVKKPCGRLLKGIIADLQIKLIHIDRNLSILRARDLYPESTNCFAARGSAKPTANIQPALFRDGYSILDTRVLRKNKTC